MSSNQTSDKNPSGQNDPLAQELDQLSKDKAKAQSQSQSERPYTSLVANNGESV